MQHVYWVHERLLAGRAGPTRFPWDPAELYAGGIRVVISLATEEQSGDLASYGLDQHQAEFPPVLLFSIGMRKAFIYQALPVWDLINQKVLQQQPTLVHCYEGKDRTGAVLAGYLVVYRGMTPEAAIQTVREANPEAMSAPGYEDAVRLLEPGRIPDHSKLL